MKTVTQRSREVVRAELPRLVKGSMAYALISSSDFPDVMIPVKCLVEDVYFEELTLFYVLKIIMFYDINTQFLLDHIRNRKFKTAKGSNGSYRIVRLTENNISNIDEFNNYFLTKIKGTRFHLEECFVRNTKVEMFALFNKIQEYLIFKQLRLANDLMIRGAYSGKIKMKSEHEFKIRMERGFGSLFKSKEESQEFFELLYQSNKAKRKILDANQGISEDI